MQTRLENYYSVPEMAARLQIAESSLRSHKMGEIKACCQHAKWGRRIYVNKGDFHRYETSAIKFTKANQVV